MNKTTTKSDVVVIIYYCGARKQCIDQIRRFSVILIFTLNPARAQKWQVLNFPWPFPDLTWPFPSPDLPGQWEPYLDRYIRLIIWTIYL